MVKLEAAEKDEDPNASADAAMSISVSGFVELLLMVERVVSKEEDEEEVVVGVG